MIRPNILKRALVRVIAESADPKYIADNFFTKIHPFIDNFGSKEHFDKEVKDYEVAHKKAQSLLNSLRSTTDDNGEPFYQKSIDVLEKEIKELEDFYEKAKLESVNHKFRD